MDVIPFGRAKFARLDCARPCGNFQPAHPYICMNAIETEVRVADMPLPETHRDLELLLEALHALNDALDQYETEDVAQA